MGGHASVTFLLWLRHSMENKTSVIQSDAGQINLAWDFPSMVILSYYYLYLYIVDI